MATINKTSETRTKLIDTIRRTLGGGGDGVDVELDADDYHMAIDKAIETYRQKSENSTEQAYLFLETTEGSNEFILPDEVMEVRQIFRRSTGTLGSGGTEIDPFQLAYTNIYLLQAGSTSTGGISTYYMYTIYQEELGKLFGFYLNFDWNPYTKKLQLIRNPVGGETLLIWVHMDRPELQMMNDRYSGPWIRDWAIAECKEMLAHAYRKYPAIPGPAGTTTLPGEQYMSESIELKRLLEEKIRNYETGEFPAWWVIG